VAQPSKLVLPGDLLAVIEEYLPGEGTYVFEEAGEIRAAITGYPFIDMKTRKLNVKPAGRTPRIPRRGSIIHGYVSMVPREDLALVRMVGDERMRRLSGSFTGVLHISQASEKYVNSIYQVVRLGDLIRAHVLSSKPPYILSIKLPQFGVVVAFCSQCGAILEKRPGSHLLVCPRCGNKEARKVSTYYMYRSRTRR